MVYIISKSLNQVENLQKRLLRFLHNECSSWYEELLKKSGKSTMNVSNCRSFCIETLNDITPCFKKNIFKVRMANRSTREKYKLNLEIPNLNQVRSGTKGLRNLRPNVWNSLPYHIKSSENLT